MAGVKRSPFDEYYIFIVGHDLQNRCDVANAMFKYQDSFRQFRSRRNLLVKCMKLATVAGHNHLNIALTPTLKSPAWATLSHQIKERYRHRIFVYVKDNGIVEADDLTVIKNLKKSFSESSILLVIDSEDDDKETIQSMVNEVGEELSSKFESAASFESKMVQANVILQQIKKLIEKPNRKARPISGSLQVGAESSVQMEVKEQPKDKEALTLVGTVKTQKEHRRDTIEGSVVKPQDADWELFQKTLLNGKAKSNHVRVNVVGNEGVGKTTLVGRLQCNEAKGNKSPTETLEINRITSRCVELEGKKVWESNTEGYEHDLNLQRMAEAMKRSENVTSVTNQTFASSVKEVNLDNGSEEFEENTFEKSDPVLSGKRIGQEKYAHIQKRENYLQKVIKKKKYSMGERMYVSYWDYAGQSSYYSTHQAFLSPSAVYLLVVDLSQDLNEKFTDSLEFRTSVLADSTAAESIHFWISSIDAYTTDKDGGHAPILLVGTHKDKVTPAQTKKMFNRIRKLIQIDIECIAIDNTLTGNDEVLNELRNCILDLGLGIVDEEIPAQWIDLERVLLEKKLTGMAVMTFAEIEAQDNKLDVPMNDSHRLDAFLEHQHCRGNLMCFHHETNTDLVILDPMILARFLNELLRNTGVQSSPRGRPGWNHDGIITKEYIQDVTHRMKECHGISDHVDDLLSILVKLNILIIHNTKQDHYFLPCLLPEKPSSGKSCAEVKEFAPRVDVDFDDKHMHVAFYHLLVSAMHKKYSLLHIQKVPQIYNMYTCFCVGKSETTWLELSWISSRLCIDVKNFSKKRKLETSRCQQILDDIDTTIEDVLRMYRHDNVGYTFRIECPEHKHPNCVLLETLKEDEEAMCMSSEKEHAVTIEEATGIYFSKELCESDERLYEVPSDKDLGRLARYLGRETALSLARLLRMSNCMIRADRAIQNSGQNYDLARLMILQIWRTNNPNHSIGKLCSKLKKSGEYDKMTLVRVVKDEDECRGDHGLPKMALDVIPNDRVIDGLARNTDRNYMFVMLELGVKIKEVERIEMDNNDMISVIREALHKWKNQNASNATLQRYLDVLQTLSKTMPCNLVATVADIKKEFEGTQTRALVNYSR